MNFPSPDAADESEFVWPNKPVDGPHGDCAANVHEIERLIQAVQATEITYRAEIPDADYVDRVDAEIVATSVLNLDDCR
jgi:hypothetical protein